MYRGFVDVFDKLKANTLLKYHCYYYPIDLQLVKEPLRSQHRDPFHFSPSELDLLQVMRAWKMILLYILEALQVYLFSLSRRKLGIVDMW